MSGQAPPLSFGTLRLASLCNLRRIGIVATAGFKYSQVFEFTRPYHNQYPEDTIKGYQRIFRGQILDPEWIVLVKEDTFDPNELEAGKDLPESTGSTKNSTERVIVGVCSWKLEEGSRRKGEFQPPLLELDRCDGPRQGGKSFVWKSRDTNPERLREVNDAIEAAEKEYFHQAYMLEMIVVHPTYWRRGHGSTLASWGTHLTETDKVHHGVIASRMGEKLFASIGFEHIKYIHVEGEGDASEGIDLAVLAIWRK